MIRFFAPILILWTTAMAQADGLWATEWSQAQSQARTSGKTILCVVTGMDWSVPSQVLDAEVLSLPETESRLAAHFILFRADLPKNIPQTERLRVAHQDWIASYPIDQVPTILVVDAKGRVLGRHEGPVDGGLPGMEKLATGFADRESTLAGLADAVTQESPGLAKVVAQDALFQQVWEWDLVPYYGTLPLDIVRGDPLNRSGKKPFYQTWNAYQRLLTTWTDRDDMTTAVADLDRLSAASEGWPRLNQDILFTKALILLNAQGDEVAARESFLAARAIDPQSAQGQRAGWFLDQLP